MNLLVLGGTEFVGRAIVEEALHRNWPVTVFNRGRHAPPEGVVTVTGDRTDPSSLNALADGTWDVVVDTWADAPANVRDAAQLLAGRAGQYVYISSRSVYPMPLPPGSAEDAPLVEASQDDGGDVEYARLKRGGELAVTAAFGTDRSLLVRAGLILGPWENIGRLPWWLSRIARGGQVLAPGPAEAGLQYIDVRDLASWTLDAAEKRLSGPYDLVGPPGHTTMRGLLEACIAVTGSQARLRWMAPEQILAAGIEPWTELPIWLPPGKIYDSIHRSDVSKALAAGLTCRPVGETVADTWAWLQAIGGVAPQRQDRPTLGLDPQVETRLLTEG